MSSRYARQIRFAPIGESGQQRLGKGRAAIVGMGALGSVIAQHLVRSGVGYVRLIDRDIVEWTNLQRQSLYTEQDVIGLLPKAAATAARLRAINSSIVVDPVSADLTASNAEALLSDVSLIIDGTDNFSVRYLINDYSLKHGLPWIYGGAVGAGGMSMTIRPHVTACYRCIFPEPPAPGATDTCETAGVISPIVDIIGSVQSVEAIKLLSGQEHALHNTLFQVDLWNHLWMPVSVAGAKRSDCPACGGRYEYLDLSGTELTAASLCGRNAVHITPGRTSSIELEQLASKLRPSGHVGINQFLLRYQFGDGMTLILFSDGRAIVQGVDDPVKAKSIYAEFLGI